ncbi:SpoIIE family protein phosphatase [Candidatus Poribacteria bacterium]|nr:SpoIIE family protein phosphatase [Candidatus Poribacteria bacterium]
MTIKQLQDRLRGAKEELEHAYHQLEADNARKTAELETARVIQKGFLPVSTPELPYLEIAAFQKPATEVGGDYYDFFLKPCEGSEPSQGFAEPSKLLVAIGDATGHGVGASLMVSATKTALLTLDAPDVTQRVIKMNTLLKRINAYHRLNMALTLVEFSYHATSGSARVKAVGGGMPPLIILRSHGKVEEIMIEGLPLGAMGGATYELTEFQLETSDVLILMSDGLPERFNDAGEIYGYAQVVADVQKAGRMGPTAAEVLEALVRLSDDWSNNPPPADDVTLLVLKMK